MSTNVISDNPSTEPKTKIRYAVVGLGYIAQIAVLPAFAHAGENSELVAIVSGDPKKLKKLAKKYRVEKTYSYEQYAECLESGEIDAVYIALPEQHAPRLCRRSSACRHSCALRKANGKNRTGMHRHD